MRRHAMLSTHAADGAHVTALLERSRGAVDPLLKAALHGLPPGLARVALYHFGWMAADGSPAEAPSGKAIRPAFVIAAAEALGAPPAAAVRAAVAVELVHNYTLLHDDIIDKDRLRRHRPTAWTVFGTADALLTGDALAVLAQQVVLDDADPARHAAAARLAACVIELCAGQQADCALECWDPRDVTVDEYLAMANAKTGALLGCSCTLGALYARASTDQVEAMDTFGRQAGLAFQIVDDVIGIWGSGKASGKPVGADLIARKKSLPVVAALASETPAGRELAALYRGELTMADVPRVTQAVERAGGHEQARAHAADLIADAVRNLLAALPNQEAARDLVSLAEFNLRRSH